MWNGMEARNMYRLLIKVFNIHMRYFVRKAVVVAWGERIIQFYENFTQLKIFKNVQTTYKERIC